MHCQFVRVLHNQKCKALSELIIPQDSNDDKRLRRERLIAPLLIQSQEASTAYGAFGLSELQTLLLKRFKLSTPLICDPTTKHIEIINVLSQIQATLITATQTIAVLSSSPDQSCFNK